MSAKSTVTTRRSSPAVAWLVPQVGQNRAPGGTSAPQATHVMAANLRESVTSPCRPRPHPGTGAGHARPMALDHRDPTEEVRRFLTERHLATLTTARPDGSPHVVPVGVTYDPQEGIARVITWSASRKARNVAARPGQRVAVCQVDGGRWLTLEGPAEVTDDPQRVAVAVARYAERYRQPKQRTDRVAIEIRVDRLLGRA
jgi:PPOX class probable F420-dependent enzyme